MYKTVIKKGDVFSEDFADFIVNPSNTDLVLGSGVSAAFKQHCGMKLQSEMKKLAPIKQSEAVITGCPGLDKFKHAIHVAVMDYSKPDPFPTLNTIKTALVNIEKIISVYNKVKLVLPLMGVGVGGLDKKDVVKIYGNFFKRKVDFECFVVIYGHKEKDYALLKKCINP